jgi:nitrogen-specific signal transduction histidine kinase/CheY-like chemotaxis protein
MRTDEGMRVLSSIVDVTKRRQLESQLRQSHKLEAIGTLASGIAHDFNNILASIIGHTELIASAAGGASPLLPDVQQVLIAADRGRQLVRRILAFSRPSDLARVPIQPALVVRETLHLLRASLPTTIEMRDALQVDTPRVLSDEAQLQQVIMNLSTNAAHAMPRGGVLEVRLEPITIRGGQFGAAGLGPGLYARLSVIDTGHGMDDETLKRAFDPFFTTKGPREGTGLGLAIVHGIVEAHQGSIEIQSRLGSGTRVDVYLPAYAEVSEKPSADDVDRSRPLVMLVEDEAPILRMLTRQIELLGYRVAAHASSVEALQILTAKPREFSLLVTDNTMPRMTGLELAQRARETSPDLPILLISGLSQRVDVGVLKAAGVTQVLGKPHTLPELKAVLEELLPAHAGVQPDPSVSS